MVKTYSAAESIRAADGSSEAMLFVFDADAKMNNDALRARQDEERMDAFIRQNRRFILGCAHKTLHRFVSESDDEWSIALIAFHEAVQSYDSGKGSFKSFAALVIKRRLMDYMDSQSKYRREVGADLSGAEPDRESAAPVELQAARAVAEKSMESSASEAAMRDEIEALGGVLQGYGFSFFDLADCSPRAQASLVFRALGEQSARSKNEKP